MAEQRLHKSFTQRILLLDVQCKNDNQIHVTILGASNKEYSLILKTNDDDTVSSCCTCLDYQMRHEICKHLYWFGHKKMYGLHPNQWDINLFNNLYWHYNHIYQEEGRNDMCGICLESIDYNNENSICCTWGCRNSIHTICWHRLLAATNVNRCIYCREWSLIWD